MILTSLSVKEAESFGGLLSATDMIQLYKLHGHPEGTYNSIIPYELTQQVVKGLIEDQDKIEAQEQSQESKHLKTPYEVPALEGRDNTPGPHHMDSIVLETPDVDPPSRYQHHYRAHSAKVIAVCVGGTTVMDMYRNK